MEKPQDGQNGAAPPPLPPRKRQTLPGDRPNITEAITMLDPSKLYVFEEPLPANMEGNQSTIYIAKERTGARRSVIIKKLKNKAHKWVTIHERGGMTIPQEIPILWRAQRVPGVIRLFNIIFTQHENSFYLVLEKPFNAVDLHTWLYEQRFCISEALVKRIVTHVICILQNLELVGIYHGDIKAENILYVPDTGEVKLIDFGHSRPKDANKPFFYAGTPIYHPPEWKNQCFYSEPAITSYSIGVLTYFLLVGYLPEFYPEKALQFSEDNSLPTQKFVQACMDLNWTRRPDLRKLLNSEWIFKNI